ncbi:MAG: hypothetical protein ACRCT1_16265 [Microcoleaceae cyanobacterium]
MVIKSENKYPLTSTDKSDVYVTIINIAAISWVLVDEILVFKQKYRLRLEKLCLFNRA